jgi:hypothetical protein
MTLQPIPSEFPYIWGKFTFLFYQWTVPQLILPWYGRARRLPPSHHPSSAAPGSHESLTGCWSSNKIIQIKYLLFKGIFKADPDPGSGAILTPGPGIRDPEQVFSGSRIPDLGSRMPNPYFWDLGDNFLGKKFYNSLKIGPNFFLQHFKTKIMFKFVKFVAT